MTAVNRFALSVLSRSNKAQSVNGEMMMDKETGQLLVKTPSGDIISYDSTARLKSHLNDMTLLAQTSGIRGTVHSMDFENFELPSVVADDTNFLLTEVTFKANNLKRFMVSVDVDTVEMTQSSTLVPQESSIILFLKIEKTGPALTRTITIPLSEFNTKVFNAADYYSPGTDLTGHRLSITGLKVKKNAAYAANAKVKHIIHSMLVVVE